MLTVIVQDRRLALVLVLVLVLALVLVLVLVLVFVLFYQCPNFWHPLSIADMAGNATTYSNTPTLCV